MNIKALIRNERDVHSVSLTTEGKTHSISIGSKADGYGSSVNGGELLFLALATCYCNDLYREAKKRDIKIERIEVEVEGTFEAEGAPATNINYSARINGDADNETLRELMKHTDTVSEIQNTLRAGTKVTLQLDA